MATVAESWADYQKSNPPAPGARAAIPYDTYQQSLQTQVPDPNTQSTLLGHSNGMMDNIIKFAGNALPTAGAIAGGIGGGALGGLAGIESGPGAIATGYAGEVAGSAAGGAAGEAAKEILQGQQLQPAEIGKQGAIFGGLQAVGGPVMSIAGKALEGVGGTLAKMVIPKSASEAERLQSYYAEKPMVQNVYRMITGSKGAPITAGQTAFKKGLMGTESMIGVQARRAMKNVWSKTIEPALDASGKKVDMQKFFNDALGKIIKGTPELGQQNARFNALQSLMEEYKNKPEATLKELQGFKEGWASKVPQKYYKGEDITDTYNAVRAELASTARNMIYDSLGKDVKQAYLDYGNLKGLTDLGKKAMTGGARKGGFGSFMSSLKDEALVPAGTLGGQALYRIGQGLELVGPIGAQTLGGLVEALSGGGSEDQGTTQGQ